VYSETGEGLPKELKEREVTQRFLIVYAQSLVALQASKGDGFNRWVLGPKDTP